MSEQTNTMSSEEPNGVEIPATKRRAPRWMKITLAVSLALNTLIVGFAVGAAWRFHAFGVGGPGPSFHRFADSLDVPKRERIMSIIGDKRDRVGSFRQEMRAARRRAADLILAEPFDKEAFRAAKDDLVRLVQQRIEQRFEALPEIAETLTLEERRRLLETMRRSSRHIRRELIAD